MDNYFWLQMMGALTALLLLLLTARLLTGRLILPAKAYSVLSFAGLTAYIVFLLASGSHFSRPRGGLGAVWDQWVAVAPRGGHWTAHPAVCRSPRTVLGRRWAC
jgi:hypothetical protein